MPTQYQTKQASQANLFADDVATQLAPSEATQAKACRNEIYHLDVFDFLNTKVADDTIDLAIVDPPYNLKKADWDTFINQQAFLQFTYRWIECLLPKLKNTASLYIFNTPLNAAYILQFLLEQGLVFQNWIVWDKKDGITAPKRKYANGQETILFFTKSEQHTFNYDAIRQPYTSTARMQHAAKKGIVKNNKRWYPNPKGKLCTDVWHISSARHKHKVNGRVQKMPHLTPKPMDMIERMIKASSNAGDRVLDCFVGSGTTALASQHLRRNFIGCDQNKEYVKIARQAIG